MDNLWNPIVPDLGPQLTDICGAQIPGFDNIGGLLDSYIQGFSGQKQIKVSPEQLLSTADDLLQIIQKAKRNLDRIRQTVESTKSYWEGTVSDLRRDTYKNEVEVIDTNIRKLKVIMEALRRIAMNYTNVESKNEQQSQSLPSSIIS